MTPGTNHRRVSPTGVADCATSKGANNPRNTPVIQAQNLGVSYGDFEAVKDLSFHVERGELYALLGTNGAGKTSTLEVLEGHRRVSSGRVRVFGEDPGNRRIVRPKTGIMLQESGFSADLTVTETIALIGALSGREDRPERLLEIVDLTGKANTRVAQLSGGEKRRLDFATAVYGSPQLVFLDEPTTGLDIQSRDALWETVDQLRVGGTTIVLTTHYLEEAQQRADRIGLMHQGRFHTEGTVAEITHSLPGTISFELPAHALSAGFAPELPLTSSSNAEGRHLITTRELQRDLHTLLTWAQEHQVELAELEAGPTRLDSVFRAVGRT